MKSGPTPAKQIMIVHNMHARTLLLLAMAYGVRRNEANGDCPVSRATASVSGARRASPMDAAERQDRLAIIVACTRAAEQAEARCRAADSDCAACAQTSCHKRLLCTRRPRHLACAHGSRAASKCHAVGRPTAHAYRSSESSGLTRRRGVGI